MGTVNDITSLAYAQLGNDGARYWNWYTDNVRPSQGYYVDGDRTPYCAEYISWLLAHTNTECIYFPDSCAFDTGDIPASYRIPFSSLKAGDIVSYNFDSDPDGDHVGIVIENHGSYIYTNEGNCSGYVRNRYRYPSEVIFGIRPKYNGSGSMLKEDGIFGINTCKALQVALQTHGYYKGYICDGDFGTQTKIALQNYLKDRGYYAGFSTDGDFGWYSIAALQMKLASTGIYTKIIDSKWGYNTTLALQKALNLGCF